MIKRFFHELNSQKISYLLISGQATVLYGAATFSEDVDIWVKPEVSNWNKFLKLLRLLRARIYKLTPPLSMELIRKGHGYHFQLPSDEKGIPFWFLDVMGVVPRVLDFASAFENATYLESEWGRLSVVGIRDLVEIKKTRRLEDYPAISNLVRIEYEGLPSKEISSNDWKWVLSNSFDIDDILYYLRRHSLAESVGASLSRKCISLCMRAIANQKRREGYTEAAAKEIALEIEDLRKQDRLYWQPIIDELKLIKEKGLLLPINKIPPETTEEGDAREKW